MVVATASNHQIMAKKCKSRGAAAQVFISAMNVFDGSFGSLTKD
jgi:hypothetical protein